MTRSSTLERRSKKYAAIQYVADTHDDKTTVARPWEASLVCTSLGAWPQIRLTFHVPLWEEIGKPTRVNVRLAKEGFVISAGNETKVSVRTHRIHLQFAPAKCGLSKHDRPRILVSSYVTGKNVVIASPEDKWLYPAESAPGGEKTRNTAWADDLVSLMSRDDRGAARMRIRFSHAFWQQIGSPGRVVIERNDAGILIKPGDDYAVGTASNSAVTEVGLGHLELPAKNRPTIRLHAAVSNGEIVIPSPDKDWLGIKEVKIVDDESKTGAVLPALDQAPQAKADPNGDVRISVRHNSAGYTMCFAVPVALMVEIGSPKRVLIAGTPHEGFTVTPAFPDQGVTVNYNTGLSVYLTTGLSNKKISKEARKAVPVNATVHDNKMKISGPPHEWIILAPEFRPDADKPRTMLLTRFSGEVPMTTPAINGNGHAPISPTVPPAKQNLVYTLPDNASVQEITQRMAELLREIAELKVKLEAQSGMQFVITSKLTMQVALPK